MERESDREAVGAGPAAQAGPAGTGSRRRRRWPWVLLAVALASVVGLRALLPTAIARGLEYALPRQIGLPLEVGNVDLELLRGGLALEGVWLGGRAQAGAAASRAPLDREQALLSWRRIFARIDWRALLSQRVLLHELALEEPVVRLVRLADGSIESPLPPMPAEPEPAVPEPASSSAP